MSTTAPNPAKRSRWMDWKPRACILADSPGSEPTKPSKPGSVGFEGATPAESPEIEAGPDPALISRATDLLNRAGARIMRLDGISTIGVWSDLDGPEVRAALVVREMDGLPLRYLDGDGIPMCYRIRRVAGEPVALNVLREMERNPCAAWKMRAGLQWMSFEEWRERERATTRESAASESGAKRPDCCSAICGTTHVSVVRDRERWLMFTGCRMPTEQRLDFASPFLDHAKRTAEAWYGVATRDWTEEAT